MSTTEFAFSAFVPPSLHSVFALIFMTLGIMTSILLVSISFVGSKATRTLKLQMSLAVMASAFCGFCSLFLFLWSKVFPISGPKNYVKEKNQVASPEKKQTINFDITNLHRLNQELIVKASLKNNLTIGVFNPIEFTVILHGSNPENGKDEWILLQNTTNQRNVTCEPNRSFRRFYLPKFLLLGIISFFLFVLLIWGQNHSINHPEYESVTSIPAYRALRTIMIILFVYYGLWIFYSITGSYSVVKQVKKKKFSRRFNFFVTIGSIPFFFSFYVLFDVYLSTITYSSIGFMSTYSLYNFYIFGYLFACLPNTSSINQEKNNKTVSDSSPIGSINIEYSNETELKNFSVHSAFSSESDKPEKKIFQKK
ncbi:transmembrane protein [Anaeramoeba flamelloides]|uniref:Transmembrane protein n=1 Tax=Anaeramoeba flamelloides TaxID=1746091 RepID=A0ABQ8X6X0_9EUKA|nr:transmembrane protein [Anaeramoeba flamelloides]